MRFETPGDLASLFGAGLLAAALTLGGLASAPKALADESISSFTGSVFITTAGWGHGRGMSQYGANEAAKRGLGYSNILSFYYPGTTAGTLAASDSLRVWIKSDKDNDLRVKPTPGLAIKDSANATLVLPTGPQYTQWRIVRTANAQSLTYLNPNGSWVSYPASTLGVALDWTFSNAANRVEVVLPSGTRAYRGSVGIRVQLEADQVTYSQTITVNNVTTENYLLSVVPAEIPALWQAEAVKAQAVAARSYAARYRANQPVHRIWDICDDASCQVYPGISAEHANSTSAVNATAGKILTYSGQVAWTEFTSSNGGYSASGGTAYPYLVAKADPYDLAANRVQTITVPQTSLQNKYEIGTLQSISLQRDGLGQFGGRVTSVTLIGSLKAATVTGAKFKADFGLNETLFRISSKLAIADVSAKNATWSGKALKPAVTVASGGKTLKLNTDYTLSYSSNTNIGTGTVTVKGKGSYTGTKTQTFAIAPKNTKVKSVTAGKKQIKIKWAKVSSKQKVSGYRISYRVKGKGAWITKSVSASKSSLTIKKLRKKLKYEVKIATYKKVSGKTYTSGLSAAKTSKPVK